MRCPTPATCRPAGASRVIVDREALQTLDAFTHHRVIEAMLSRLSAISE